MTATLLPRVVCQHCQTPSSVRRKRLKVKRGVSGGKAAAALLTGGATILVTGLSRKQRVSRMTCDNCGMRWLVEV
jgi:hypothetical protein